MSQRTFRRVDGGQVSVDDGAVAGLQEALRGEILGPESPGYDEARTIWNAMIDRKPGLIARCLGASDVMQAVRFAGEHGLLTSIRGGGHNIAGNAVCDGGLTIDLSRMKSVRVDPSNRTARVEPGCTLGDFDRETQAFGLATPTGINSTTGLAGLTLGGGFGWLTRKHGMTVDNLRSADVVTAAGERVTASESEHPDLFWALRGGGGNFGVVTSFEFGLHEVGPEVWAGLVVYPMDDAQDVLRRWRDFAAEAPDELTVWTILRLAPPLPFLPESWHGRPVVAVALLHAGTLEEGEAAAEPVLHFGEAVGTHVGPVPYVGFQQAFDPLLTPGARNYWKSHDFEGLTDEALDTAVEQAADLPSPHCEIFFGQLGGAMGRVAPDATAYPHRSSDFVMNVHGRWESPEEDEEGIAWSRRVFSAMTPHATGGVYVNFLTQDETDRVRNAYGPNYDRLARVKGRYDPDNLFRMNMNVRPGG